jgi:DNA-binding transcriptional MerR regulator
MVMDTQPDEILSVSALARERGCSESYIRKLADTGKIPVERLTNGQRIFRRSKLREAEDEDRDRATRE